MPTVALRAHFDGERVVLDEAFDLAPDSQLIVTVLPKPDTEDSEWEALAVENLARAYGPDEPEYTLDDLKRRP